MDAANSAADESGASRDRERVRLNTRVASLLAAIVLFGACGPPSPGPAVQQLLDAYAPSLPIGSRLTQDARDRYDFRVAAYVGYVDDRYTGPDDVRRLSVSTDRTPAHKGADPQIPPSAKVTAVSVEAPTPASTARVDARIRAVLGAPAVACYTDGYGRRVEVRFWPGANGRGIQMLVFHERPPMTNIRPGPYEQGSATVEFGAQPVSPQHVDLKPCPP